MELERALQLARYDSRRVVFDGTMNCRDLGGLPTRDGNIVPKGRIYRSGRLSNLQRGDYDEFLRKDFRTIADLRLPFERERFPDVLPDDSRASIHHLGYLPDNAMEMFSALNEGDIGPAQVWLGMKTQYERMAIAHPEIHRSLFELILSPERWPFLIHCSGGKDRTGVASAILLSIAGVEREVVVADYLVTNLDVPQLGVLGPNVKQELRDIVGYAHRVLIEAALDAIEQTYGSYTDYLKNGVKLEGSKIDELIKVLTD